MFAIAFQRAADRLLVVDPGLTRFVTALRATLATLLTAIISIHAASFASAPLVSAGLGVLFSMIAPLFLRDATARGWRVSLLSMYLVAVLSFGAASALEATPLAADIAFIVLLFAGMLVQACGPRLLGCALVGLVAFYLGLYLHQTQADATLTLALSLIGPCVVASVGRWIVPPRRCAALRLATRTVVLRALDVLRPTRHTHAALSSMNEAAMAFEDRLALLGPDAATELRTALVELEVAAGQYVFDETNRPAREAAFRGGIARLETLAASGISGDAPSLHTSAVALRQNLTWLPATRVAVAALLAMFAGQLISSERWFWAVITTFVVFLGTRSVGDTLYRALQRTAGTFAGALVSTLLVASLGHMPAVLTVAMLLCVFGWAYFVMNAYGQGVFFVTVLVGLVYGALGHAVQPLVELRIEEVAIGCVASAIAACVIRPLDTTRHVEARFVAVLDALIAGVNAASSGSNAGVAMRTLDRQWHDFRVALRPQRMFMWEPRYERVAGALQCCVHHVRMMLAGQATLEHESSVIDGLEAIRARYTQARAPEIAIGSTALEGAVALLAQRLSEPDPARTITRFWRTHAIAK